MGSGAVVSSRPGSLRSAATAFIDVTFECQRLRRGVSAGCNGAVAPTVAAAAAEAAAVEATVPPPLERAVGCRLRG